MGNKEYQPGYKLRSGYRSTDEEENKLVEISHQMGIPKAALVRMAILGLIYDGVIKMPALSNKLAHKDVVINPDDVKPLESTKIITEAPVCEPPPEETGE